jgi:beta-lactamase regulating signal transducer with metallopeptidase domain
MAVTIALIALAPQRQSRSESVVLPLRVEGTAVSVELPPQTIYDRVAASFGRARAAIEGGIAHTFATAARLAPTKVEQALVLLWGVLSVAVFLVYLTVHGRLTRAKRAWPVTNLHGTRVRLAPNAGPAVVGFVRPEIVVPNWLLQRRDSEQRMVVAHEEEHLRARDPLLLTVACVAVALVAWHPAMWWMFSRLRLAVELDCDDRIVRSGFAPRSYGALLIELAGRCSGGMHLGAPALADGSSHLERRLIAMTSRRPKFARISGFALAACSLALVALACDAKLPTSEEVNSMDVAAAEGAAKRVYFLGTADSAVTYTIDGRAATAEEAHSLAPEAIASVEVLKKRIAAGGAGERQAGEVRILTRRAADTMGIAGHVASAFPGQRQTRLSSVVIKDTLTLSADTVVFGDGTPGAPHEVRMRRLQPMKGEPFNGVLLLDGVRVDNSRLTSIAPGEIVSIEVVKGDAARKLFADSAAANGVIRITTRGRQKKR